MVRKNLPKKIKICVFGMDYIGLVNAVYFVKIGYEIVRVDKDKK